MHNINDLFGLAFDSSTNTLYGTQFSSSRGFYTLNQSNGAATFIATIGVGIGGLKYNSADNELVGTNDGSGKIHHQSPPGHRRYWQALDSLLTAILSMTQAQTCIITLSDGNFYAIDTSNGYARTLFIWGLGNVDSLELVGAGPAPVPEPSTWALITIGLGVLGFRRRVR